MSTPDIDPITAAIANAREARQTESDKRKAIQESAERNLVALASKARTAIKAALDEVGFLDGKASVAPGSLQHSAGRVSTVLRIPPIVKQGITISAATELAWVYGDGVNIGHGEGGHLQFMVLGPHGRSDFVVSVGQLPFQGNYAIDGRAVERSIAENVQKVA